MWTTGGILEREQQLRDKGHEVVREFVFGGRDSQDGAGWVVRVDGKEVAAGPSMVAVEVALRE